MSDESVMVSRSGFGQSDPPLEEGVSFIMFTYNSSKLIGPTLKAFLGLPKADLATELLLVDNNSSDDTIEKAESLLSNATIPYTVIRQPKPGLFYSRVAGIESAKYRYFVFVDDDNLLQGDWVSGVGDLLNNREDLWLVGGINESVLQAHTPSWWESQKHAFAVGKANPSTGVIDEDYMALWGAGLSGRTNHIKTLYRNAPFWLVGRTENTLLAGEDSELCYWTKLAGGKIYQSELTLKHVIPQRKLSLTYLMGIHKGFRISDHYLLQYRIALSESSWLLHNLRYGVALSIKWLAFPVRRIVSHSKDDLLRIKTRTPGIAEVAYFWMHLPKWRSMYNKIIQNKELLRSLLLKE